MKQLWETIICFLVGVLLCFVGMGLMGHNRLIGTGCDAPVFVQFGAEEDHFPRCKRIEPLSQFIFGN